MPSPGSVVTAPRVPASGGLRGITHRLVRVTRLSRRWLVPGAFVVVFAVLFFAYLGLSRTYPENSDEANILLMANDMLHGNYLMQHWITSDVPFITTELPEMALLVKIFGLHLNTAHIAVAVTYTLVVLFGVLLARGPRQTVSGKTAFARMAVAGGIMLGPQTGAGVFILLLSVGHIGTAVPVMLTWLIVDRMGKQRWVPAVVAVLLAWALVADPLVKVVAIWPLMLVCVVRLLTWLVRGDGSLRERLVAISRRWFELSMLAAAALGWWLASLINSFISSSGGYRQNPVPFALVPSKDWWPQARIVIDGLLSMFGANFVGQTGWHAVLAVLHLVGVALAVWGVLATIRRFFRWPGDFVDQVLVTAIVANLVAYIPSTLVEWSPLNAREIAPVLPFAAVLAGRQLGPRLAESRLSEIRLRDIRLGNGPRTAFLLPVLALALAGSVWTVGSGALSPAAPAPYASLITWLESRHLTYGLAGYWQASIITVESGGKVTIRAVTAATVHYKDGGKTNCDIQLYPWESKTTWYNPRYNRATFIMMDEDRTPTITDTLGAFNLPGGALYALGDDKHYTQKYFGNAANVLGAPHGRATYILRIYRYNLLTKIPLDLPQTACLSS
jgi:hypothetical protein